MLVPVSLNHTGGIFTVAPQLSPKQSFFNRAISAFTTY